MRKLIYIILPFVLFISCGKEFVSTEYYPLDEGFRWTFSGPLHEISVEKKEIVASGQNFILAYKDSLGAKIWQETVQVRNGRVFLKTYKPSTSLLHTVTFNPAIPISPVSANRSEIEVFESTTTHYDSTALRYKVRIENEIEEIEDVDTPAGIFPASVRLKTTILYQETPRFPLMEETIIWWYAKNVGPVKYSTSVDQGTLQNASLGSCQLPVR